MPVNPRGCVKGSIKWFREIVRDSENTNPDYGRCTHGHIFKRYHTGNNGECHELSRVPKLRFQPGA